MRKFSSIASVASLILATVCMWTSTAGGQEQGPPVVAPHVPGELLVRFHPTASAVRRTNVVAALGARVLHQFGATDVGRLRIPSTLTVDAAMQRLRGDAAVLSVQPNYIRHMTAAAPPNDPYWLNDALWGLQRINVRSAWTNFTTGDGSVVIADIDTGVNYNHPDLAANMWRNPGEIPGNGIDDDGDGYVDDVFGIDVVNGDSDPMDDNGHGTHTAGTAAARGNDGVGIVGVNWNAKILACKFLDATGSGTDAGAIACFDYIVALKNRGINIRVSNNSWGQQRDPNQFPSVLKNAIDAAGNAGILNVFAAGNTGGDNDSVPFDPASLTSPSILAVAASDNADNRPGFSNYGASSVDIAAPGVSILSAYGGGYAYLSGTSMATPHVAGAAALLASLRPAASVATLKTYLLSSVDRLGQWTGLVASGGRLNVFAAGLAAAGNAPPSVVVVSPANGASYTEPATISIVAAASDSDDAVSQVTFFADGVPIGSDTSDPYALTWTNVPAGVHTITASAIDTVGATTTSAPVTVTVNARPVPIVNTPTPFGGSPWSIPGTIEAENFDEGGEGIAYHDTTIGNSGAAYRSTDVDIQPTSDVGGGFNVGWMTAGEWLNYTVSVAHSGTYTLTVRTAAKNAGGVFHIEFGGIDRTGPLTISNTGAWQTWADVTTIVSLSGGTQSMRLIADSNGTVFGNVNYVRLTPTGGGPTPFGGIPRAIPGVIEAEDFDDGGEGVAYHDTASGNKGGQYRSTDVDIEQTLDVGGGYDVGWVKPGEWLNYTVYVQQSRTYTLNVRVAASGAGGVFHVEFAGVDRTGPLTIPDTGGWQTWTDVSVTVDLPAGTQSMRISADANSSAGIVGNINHVRIQ